MICPKCGMETSPLDNGPCVVCGPVTAHSCLEKIEPIRDPYQGFCDHTVMRLSTKLNEVIEKVNLIMEVIGRVK